VCHAEELSRAYIIIIILHTCVYIGTTYLRCSTTHLVPTRWFWKPNPRKKYYDRVVCCGCYNIIIISSDSGRNATRELLAGGVIRVACRNRKNDRFGYESNAPHTRWLKTCSNTFLFVSPVSLATNLANAHLHVYTLHRMRQNQNNNNNTISFRARSLSNLIRINNWVRTYNDRVCVTITSDVPK